MQSIMDDPMYKVKNIMFDIKANLHIDISYKKVWYGCWKAIQFVCGD